MCKKTVLENINCKLLNLFKNLYENLIYVTHYVFTNNTFLNYFFNIK